MSFYGYPRPDGRVGVRNYVLILPGGMVSSKICDFVRGTRTILTADVGSGRTKKDRDTIARVLVGLGRNANVAGVILHDMGQGQAYPELNPEDLASRISESDKPVELITSSKYPGTFRMMEKGVLAAKELVRKASSNLREKVEDRYLSIAVKCGYSDATSGIAGNPVVGSLFDRVIDLGGTAFFGENTEIIGAEHLLAKRGVDKKVVKKIILVAKETEEKAKKCGEDIRSINPIPSNIAGGISTLEEKSLGAISKGGTRSIQGVLEYGEIPSINGLYFVDNWMTQLSIFLGYVASGATVTLFQLGGPGFSENTLFLPSLGIVSPLLWATANHRTYEAAIDSVDFYSGSVIQDEESIEAAGERLFDLVKRTASGQLTKTEPLRYQEVSQLYLQDAAF
ncbi:MAG: UxaA family hydrolase [Candidatus Thorarchaeota archaeon]